MEQQGKMDKKDKDLRRFAIFSYCIVAIGIAVAITILYVYFNHFKGDFGDNNQFGAFGDFVGGVLNPFLTFLTVILLISSLRFQLDELRETRRELEDTKTIHKESLKEQRKQSLMLPTLKLLEENTRTYEELINSPCNTSSKRDGGFSLSGYTDDPGALRAIAEDLQQRNDNIISTLSYQLEDLASRLIEITENLLEYEVPTYLIHKDYVSWLENFHKSNKALSAVISQTQYRRYSEMHSRIDRLQEKMFKDYGRFSLHPPTLARWHHTTE